MFLQSFYTPGLAINSYLIGDRHSRRAAVIDPARHVAPYLACADREGLAITDIVETHVHADFISGAKELKHRLGNKPLIHCSSMGGPEWTPRYADKEVTQGYTIALGSIRLEALHTPGHTPEHLIWLAYDESRNEHTPCLAFTGDALFVGSVGRPDLLGKEEIEKLARQLYDSLFVKLANLPDYLEIYPAHGAGSLCGKALSPRLMSTLGYERQANPMLIPRPYDKWVTGLLQDMPAAPHHFRRMKQINVAGAPLLGEPAAVTGKAVVIDIRGPEEFAQGHLKGALNIPLGASFCNWAGSVLEDEAAPLTLVAASPNQLHEAALNLQLIGFDQVPQKMIWDGKPQDIETLPTISAEDMAEVIQAQTEPFYLVDVRTDMEWKGGRIKEAQHVELPYVKDQSASLPKDASLYMICGSGYRASIAASLLKHLGFSHVHNVRGGMMAWRKAQLPVDSG